MSEQEAQNTLEFDRQTLMAGRTLYAEMSETMAGVRREWLSTKGVLRRPDGKVVGLFGISRDLSHHRRTEEAHRHSEALFRAASSSSFDAFFILQDEGPRCACRARQRPRRAGAGPGGRGQAEGRLPLGFTPRGLPGAPPPCARKCGARAARMTPRWSKGLPARSRRWFRRQLHAGGRVTWPSRCATSPSSASNELRLRLNERMASIGMLAAGVAHEINNPLAFVSSNLSFIGTELDRLSIPEEDSHELRDAITEAREGTERMRLIVQSLRALSRGDAVNTHALDLHEVLENSVHLAWSKLRSRGRLIRDYGELPQVMGNYGAAGAGVHQPARERGARACPRRAGRSAW